MRAFMISFPADIGALYAQTLTSAMASSNLDPTDAAEITIHNAIFDLLVP